jgi:hypothetical protein
MIRDVNLKSIRVLALVPEHNSHGKKDVTGAFLPEAKKLVKLARADSKLVQIDNSLPFNKRRAATLAALKEAGENAQYYDSVAIFCHGWLDGIQLGFKRRHVEQLAQAIGDVTGHEQDVVVPLFCCSTGEDPDDDPLTAAGTGDDSFADKLRDALCQSGMENCRVMAHTTVAHTTSNPMVLFMDGMCSPEGGAGGYAPVSPKSKLWPTWKRTLRDRKGSTMRLRFPYMDVVDIHEELKKLKTKKKAPKKRAAKKKARKKKS